jgi:hypothetical protein
LVSRILVSDKPCQPAHRFERRSLRIGPGCVVSRWEGRIEIERPGRGSGAGVLRACLRSPDSCTRPDRSPEIIVRLPGATAQLDMAPSPAKAAISSMRLSPLPVWTEMTIFVPRIPLGESARYRAVLWTAQAHAFGSCTGPVINGAWV